MIGRVLLFQGCDGTQHITYAYLAAYEIAFCVLRFHSRPKSLCFNHEFPQVPGTDISELDTNNNERLAKSTLEM